MVRPATSAPGAARPDVRERGDIVVGWLVRVVATLGVLGVLLFDAISVGTATMSVTDQASEAARAASTDWFAHHDQQSAFDVAWKSATQADATNTVDTHTFRVEPNGTVHVTVHRTAPTLVLRLLGPLSHWADVAGQGVGRSTA